jgi:hypothetical protein
MNRTEDRILGRIDAERRRVASATLSNARREAAAQRLAIAECVVRGFIDPLNPEASYRALADAVCAGMSATLGAAWTGAYLAAKAGQVCAAIPGPKAQIVSEAERLFANREREAA